MTEAQDEKKFAQTLNGKTLYQIRRPDGTIVQLPTSIAKENHPAIRLAISGQTADKLEIKA